MAVMCGVVGALSAFYHDSLDINDPHHREVAAFRLIAKLPTLVAMAYKYNMGQPFVYPRNDLSFTANFMRMMFAVPAEDYKVNEVLVRALDARAHFDGYALADMAQGDRLLLRRSSQAVRFVHPPGYSYFVMLREKLGWSEAVDKGRDPGDLD